MDGEFRVRFSYTSKAENLSQTVQKEYDKLSAIDHIVLWYIANYTLEELKNVIKIPGINITRESDGMKITFENPEMEKITNIPFTVVTDMLMEFAQDYSYTELPVRLRSTILSVVQSDPPDALKSGVVVLVSDKKFGLVGNKDMLDDTRKALIQRAENLQIWKETVDIQPAHEELIEKLSIIETLHQKHQVQIGLHRILNVSGTKGNVEKCVAEYNSIVSGIKPEGQNIPQTWVDLLNNKEVQDYIREELRRENIRCVWRVDKQGRKVLVYSLDSKTSREACRIIYESISDGKYPNDLWTICQHDKTGNTDVVGHSQVQNGTGKCQHDKTGNTDVVGHSQVQNVTEKCQQDKTGNTDVVEHSQVQNVTEKCQQDKTENTDVVGHSQVQNVIGKCQQDKTENTDVVGHSQVQNVTGTYQQDKTANTDVGHSQVQNGTGKYQQDETGNTDVVGYSQVQNVTEKCQQDKTGNTDVVGHSQVQNVTEKCQQDKTENTDVVGHSQVQNVTEKCQQDKTENTDVVGHSQVQNLIGKYQQDKTGNTDGGGHSQVQNETGKYQQDETGSTDGGGHSLCQNVTGKNQQDERENTDVVGYCMAQAPCNDADFIEEVIKDIVNTPCNDDDLQTGHMAQTLGIPTVGEQFSVDKQPSATNQKSKVCKPVGEVTEVRLHIDNDRLMYIQEHQREVLNNISESHGVRVRLENNDEFVITGGMESTYKAQKDLIAICKGVMCCSAEVETADLYRPEVTTKLGDLERKERCIIEFPGVHPQRPRCLHSWVYLHDQMTITITCGPVENASADVIVLPVNAMGDIIGDSDDVRQAYFDQSQTKSKFAKENILFLPNSSTLNCLSIAFAYIPEWTNEGQVDDEELKKFEKLLKHVIERGVRSVVIPVDITEGFPFSTFGCELVVKLLCQQSHLKYRLEVFLCTKTLYNGLLLKSKLQKSHFLMEQGDRITEVSIGIEDQLEISRGLFLEKVIQIHVKNESMISMQSKVLGQPVFDRCMSGTNGYAKVMVDVIVNSVERNLDLTEGCFSTALLEAGGSAIQDECTRIYPDGICYGDVAVTVPGRLQCKILCHGAILGKWIPSGNFSIRVLKSVLRKCLVETEKRQYKTIAMPAVGTGTLGYPYHRVAEAMFDVVEEYQRDHQKTCITDVFFVIHQDDKKVLEAFKFQEERNRKRPMKLHTAARDDQPVEYIESFVSDIQLRFQTLQLANVLHMVDKPEAVVTFDFHRSTDSVIHEWNKDGNYIDIVAHHDGTDDTFKSVVDAILNITQENMITSVAFHVHLNSFVTRSPVELAEYVREIVYRRTFPYQSLLSMSTKFVYHYIRLIQFVVNNNTDIRDYIPTGFTGYMKKLFSYPLEWHFVSYTIRSNSMCKVIAEDGATVKRVKDEVRRLITQQKQLDQEQEVRKGISSSLAED